MKRRFRFEIHGEIDLPADQVLSDSTRELEREDGQLIDAEWLAEQLDDCDIADLFGESLEDLSVVVTDLFTGNRAVWQEGDRMWEALAPRQAPPTGLALLKRMSVIPGTEPSVTSIVAEARSDDVRNDQLLRLAFRAPAGEVDASDPEQQPLRFPDEAHE